METRHIYLKKLSKYISETNADVNSLINEIGWVQPPNLRNQEIIVRDNQKQKIAEPDDEVPLPESFKDTRHSVKFDIDLQNEIVKSPVPRVIPQSHKDFVLNFTRDERLAMHNYVIQKTGHFDQPEESILFQIDNEGKSKQKMTLTEIMMLQKRRPIKYRISKNLPFSYTEEIRNLINDQMDVLRDHLRSETTRSVNESRNNDSKHEKSRNKNRLRHKKHSKERRRSSSRSRKHPKRRSRSPRHHHHHKSRK